MSREIVTLEDLERHLALYPGDRDVIAPPKREHDLNDDVRDAYLTKMNSSQRRLAGMDRYGNPMDLTLLLDDYEPEPAYGINRFC